MKRSRSSALALAVNLKPLVSRAAVALLVLSCLALIAMEHTGTGPATLRKVFTDVFTPVVETLARPADAVGGIRRWLGEMAALRQENVLLKADNARLLRWQAAATALSSENEKLRQLLKFAPLSTAFFTSARVAADTSGPYSRSVIITSGTDQGVEEDLAVVNEAGFVGRVVDPGKKTSRVLLLTDMNSRIPVISRNSNERAIAGGNNGEALTLSYLPENTKLAVGETIVTSGDGKVLPPGLPVGVVTKVGKGTATIRPFVDGYGLEYVSVVGYSN